GSAGLKSRKSNLSTMPVRGLLGAWPLRCIGGRMSSRVGAHSERTGFIVRETRRHGPQPEHTISETMAHGPSSVPRMCARHERWHRGPGVAAPAGLGLSLPARLALGTAQQSWSSLPLRAYLKAPGYAVC